VGVPDSTPLAARLSPGGSAPLAIEKLGGGVPLAAKVYENGAPTVPDPGGLAAVKAGGTWFEVTEMVSDPVVALPAEFEARTRKVNGPAAVGVPDSTPPADRPSPGGREPLDTEKLGAGLPLAVKVYE